jgi:hypothetical protein
MDKAFNNKYNALKVRDLYYNRARIISNKDKFRMMLGKYYISETKKLHSVCCEYELAQKNLIEFKNVRYTDITGSSRWKDAMDKLNAFKSKTEDRCLKDENIFSEESY